MSNLKIVANNLALNATLSPSTQSGGLVADNLKLDSKTAIWRTAGTIDQLIVTHASSLVSCVSFPICNLTSTATLRVRLYALEADSVPIYDSGDLLCCEYTAIDKLDFSASALSANTFSYGGGTYATLFFPALQCEKVIIGIIDTNNPAGYLEFSSLVVGHAWSPIGNADYGATWSLSDTSKQTRNDSGDLMTDRGARYKSISLNFNAMNASDRAEFMQILMRNGTSENLFLSLFPESEDQQERQMYQVYGKINKLAGLTRTSYAFDKSALSVQEI